MRAHMTVVTKRHPVDPRDTARLKLGNKIRVSLVCSSLPGTPLPLSSPLFARELTGAIMMLNLDRNIAR